MRLAIVGSRDYPDLEEVREYVRSQPSGTVIVTGGAKGVDTAAEEEARLCGMEVIVLKPDWDKYGKSAGHIRNADIVNQCDKLSAFSHNDSPGTRSSTSMAKKKGKLLQVFKSEEAIQRSIFDYLDNGHR